MRGIVKGQHEEPVHDITDMQSRSLKHINNLLFIIISCLDNIWIRANIGDKFLEDGISHVEFIEVEVLQLI